MSVAKSEVLRIMTWLKCGLKNVIFIMKTEYRYSLYKVSFKYRCRLRKWFILDW